MILEQIKGPEDLKKLTSEELSQLAEEIRAFLIEKISHTGGHLASNLGVVELTIALFRTFDLPEDKIIWDVGHQSYTHKILSGRRMEFDELRQYGGLSGFPKRKESPYDSFDTGHSSTSISAGLGIAQGRDILGEDYKVVSVIGDGALTGGMAYEALNNAARMKKNFIIILNDNKMSISENVGGMSRYLGGLRTGAGYNDLKKNVADTLERIPVVGGRMIDKIKRTKNSIKQLFIPGMLFENMGITYLGPVDGHNIPALCKVLKEAQKLDHAVLVHVLTKKGKGYEPAEKNPAHFHGVSPFDIKTGKPLAEKKYPTYTDVFSKKLCQLGETHPELVAVTAAMPDGTGVAAFGKKFPDRFFDVGIAEEHAVAMASGIARNGGTPIFGVFSPFLQRTYDQLSSDLCLNNNPAVIMVFMASVYGMNSNTHLGIYDIPMISHIPNLVYLAPTSKEEYLAMFKYATTQKAHPIAIRIPMMMPETGIEDTTDYSLLNKYQVVRKGSSVAIIALGDFFELGVQIADKYKILTGNDVTLINPKFITGIDEELLECLKTDHELVLTLEDGIVEGGFGQTIASFYGLSDMKVKNYGIKKSFPTDFRPEELMRENGLSVEQIIEDIKSVCREHVM